WYSSHMGGAAIDSSFVRARGKTLAVAIATLVCGCVVYTPDLLNDDAVSLGGGPSASGTAPAFAAPSATTGGVRPVLERVSPNHLGALVVSPTESEPFGDWGDGGA